MILFIGDEPSRLNTDKEVAFKGAACETRLNEWIKRVNRKETYMVINRVDKDFHELVGLCVALNEPIVALGNKASGALKNEPHFKLPHPSGRNRQINDKKLIEQKLTDCKKYIEEMLCTK